MKKPVVGIVMGSKSDYETLKHGEQILIDFNVPYEISVKSAHRMAKEMFEYATSAEERGLKVIIAGAGGAAHLPGMVSALTPLPVLGVPIESRVLKGVDSLLSIVQMPSGIPTATFAIGQAGAVNAALFAVQILALEDEKLLSSLKAYREKLTDEARAGDAVVKERLTIKKA
ncbi:MAG TPA: 5-(carboxyamino)imidazole ribonucleotide mutase [Candidatus Melainabacteria bacterium]|jgi:5-(carboxyamino)imidazole ribonucleotide mutase|nr:5-(carboxyamino)imidazole ribonucleotide mutase [Candidatus Melainabacteria bacterium]